MIFTRRRDDRIPDTGPVHLTAEGIANLKKRLSRLKESLPQLIEETKRTAAYGDRSDSAEYKEAKSALRRANSQIIGTEDRLRRAVLINPVRNLGIVQIGSTVILDIDKISKTFEIVGSIETNPGSGRISNKSPLGEALLGKKIGDTVNIKTPGGEKKYRVTKID
ncbi:MAG: transcription elongation factor GreA [Parcubacteria group bacterium LiPW_15]|nr:MAG: transcription elongation factor GreA [Parcubacteria group bacterium LiPW_15]